MEKLVFNGLSCGPLLWDWEERSDGGGRRELPGEDMKRRVSIASCSCMDWVFLFAACSARPASTGVCWRGVLPFADVGGLLTSAVVILLASSSLGGSGAGVWGICGVEEDAKREEVEGSELDCDNPLRCKPSCEVLDGDRGRYPLGRCSEPRSAGGASCACCALLGDVSVRCAWLLQKLSYVLEYPFCGPLPFCPSGFTTGSRIIASLPGSERLDWSLANATLGEVKAALVLLPFSLIVRPLLELGEPL